MKTALSIAGSDCSGGAGIQADLKTMTLNGVFAMSAITALTAQNTTGVSGILEVSPAFLAQQIDAVFTDIRPDAVKIGMVSSAPLIATIAERLRFYQARHIVVDPVMVATSGSRLMETDAVRSLREQLFPLAEVITPNRQEAEVLSGRPIHSREEMLAAARAIAFDCDCSVLLKGGHSDTDPTPTVPAAPFPAPLRRTWPRGIPCRRPSRGPKATSPPPFPPGWTWALAPARWITRWAARTFLHG